MDSIFALSLSLRQAHRQCQRYERILLESIQSTDDRHPVRFGVLSSTEERQ